MGTHIDFWQKLNSEPRDLIEPDNMVMAVLQDMKYGTITERAMPMSKLSVLVNSVAKFKKQMNSAGTPYRILYIHSYKNGDIENADTE